MLCGVVGTTLRRLALAGGPFVLRFEKPEQFGMRYPHRSTDPHRAESSIANHAPNSSLRRLQFLRGASVGV
ncbi:MAG: hypothetical protein FD138_4691, partial [Planctomycetota bacterium]